MSEKPLKPMPDIAIVATCTPNHC